MSTNNNWEYDLSLISLILSLPDDVLARLEEDFPDRREGYKLLEKLAKLPVDKWKEAGAPDYLIEALLDQDLD